MHIIPVFMYKISLAVFNRMLYIVTDSDACTEDDTMLPNKYHKHIFEEDL